MQWTNKVDWHNQLLVCVELDLLHIQLYCRKLQCLLKTKSQTNPFNSILFSKALIFVLYSKIQQVCAFLPFIVS